MDRLSYTIVCLLLACQTRPPDTAQKHSEETAATSKKQLDPREVAAANKAFWRILMPENSGCGIERTQAIRNEAALDKLLRIRRGTCGMEGLYSQLESSSIDFEHETLLLLCHNASGGGIQVQFDTASLFTPLWPTVPRVLTFRISTKSVEMAGITAVVPYCYPVIVDRSLAEMVVLKVNADIVFAMALDDLSPYGPPTTDRK